MLVYQRVLLISPDVSFSPTPEKWSVTGVTSWKDDSGVETPETAVDTPAEPAAYMAMDHGFSVGKSWKIPRFSDFLMWILL